MLLPSLSGCLDISALLRILLTESCRLASAAYFLGDSSNASCQSLKLQTEIKQCVCLFGSFREKHLSGLFSAKPDKPHKNGNSLLICKSLVLQGREEM